MTSSLARACLSKLRVSSTSEQLNCFIYLEGGYLSICGCQVFLCARTAFGRPRYRAAAAQLNYLQSKNLENFYGFLINMSA
jgi:hypothetical protein